MPIYRFRFGFLSIWKICFIFQCLETMMLGIKTICSLIFSGQILQQIAKITKKVNHTSSWSKVGRFSVETSLYISCSSFSSLIPDHVSIGKANKSAVKTSSPAGCILVQLLPEPQQPTFVGNEGTSTSTPCSLLPLTTVPETTVMGLSPLALKHFTQVSLQQNPLEDTYFPAKNSAPWQQTLAAMSGKLSLWPENGSFVQHEFGEDKYFVTCLKRPTSCTWFKTSACQIQKI